MKGSRRAAAWILGLLLFSWCLPGQTRAALTEVGAASAVVMDGTTTRVLGAKNAHTKLPMASTTKIMTALLAIEKGELDELVRVPDIAYGVEGSSMYLNRGETLSLRDLLYGLMLSSGNDAAVTIACHIGGSVEGFAAMMNARAQELGCVNTHFVTPNGLHNEDHYTTAYDLALIAAEAMKNADFQTIVGTQYHKTATGDIPRTLKNKNKVLWQYEGGNGVKTGFTKAAGRCLVFSAERNGNTVVGVVLNAPNMWQDAYGSLDYAFENYCWQETVKAGEPLRSLKVEHGMKNRLEVAAKDDILIPVLQEADEEPEIRISCPGQVQAPVLKGQAVGMLEVWMDGRLLASTPLVAQETVLKKEYPYYIWKLIRDWTA